MEEWNVEDADERLKQIVRQANCCGAQHVVVNGEAAAVVLSETEYGRLLLAAASSDTEAVQGTAGADAHVGCSDRVKNEPETGASFFAELRRPFDEAAARGEDVYWPWDWDCEKREWVPPEDHAVSP